jgi:hypothetical protein
MLIVAATLFVMHLLMRKKKHMVVPFELPDTLSMHFISAYKSKVTILFCKL